MKNTLLIVTFITILFTNTLLAYADDNIKSFINKKNDILSISKIVNIKNNSITIDVQKVIYGKAKTSTIIIDDFTYYNSDEPKIGDFILLGLDVKGVNYYIKNEIYKLDSYSTSKIMLTNSQNNNTIKKLEIFINNSQNKTIQYDIWYISITIVFLFGILFGVAKLTNNKNAKFT